MKHFFSTLSLKRLASQLTFSFVCVCAMVCSASAQTQPPNIILIMVDDLGYMDINTFATRLTGTPASSQFYETPNIDKMATDGVAFSRYYTNPLCTPARAAILTGMNSAKLGLINAFGTSDARSYRSLGTTPPTGARELDIPFSTDPSHKLGAVSAMASVMPNGQFADQGKDAALLPELLSHYRSAMVGKWHIGGHSIVGHRPQDFGFEVLSCEDEGFAHMYENSRQYWHTEGGNTIDVWGTEGTTELSINWITSHVSSQPTRPFFLYVPYFAPHGPLQAKAADVAYFKAKSTNGWNEHNNSTYAAMILAVDQQIGRLRKSLEQLKISENTVIIFTSDNGGIHGGGATATEPEIVIPGHPQNKVRTTNNYPLRGDKAQITEGGIRVPFIICWPGKWVPNRWFDTPINVTQVAPTLLDVAKASTNPAMWEDGNSIVPLLEGQSANYKAQPIFVHEPFYRNSTWEFSGGSIIMHPPATVMIDGDYKLIAYHTGVNRLYRVNTDFGENADLAASEPERVAAMLQKTAAWRFANIESRYDMRAKLPHEAQPADSVPPIVPFVR
jgi:arylsulfatase A-like enzyme